jgi:hypothetical protein
MVTNIFRAFRSAALSTVVFLSMASFAAPVEAATEELDSYIGSAAPSFDSPDAAVTAFKSALAADDFDGLAKLLGLDPAKLKAREGVMDTYAKIREGAAKQVVVRDDDDRKLLDIGANLWPLPFPLTQDKSGKWAFNTRAGIEEIINRRVGENETEAIASVTAYVEAQRDYAAEDRDGDGVLEYAQKLISTEGKTDGLYWPIEQGDGDSPAGAFINQAELGKAMKEDSGYFGYRFRILRGQGDNVAGGRYDYVINGNMIAGFGLIAWPVQYARTGVYTFEVNQAGIVYQRDLGPDTEHIVKHTFRFNPNKSWTIVNE